MKAKNFKIAAEMARSGKFEDCGFYRRIRSAEVKTDNGYTFGGYLENWVGLCPDDEHGYFSIQLSERGWMLCYDDRAICRVPQDVADALDERREDAIHASELEYRRQAEWHYENEELHRNYGPGKI